jgi:hypothetical protein
MALNRLRGGLAATVLLMMVQASSWASTVYDISWSGGYGPATLTVDTSVIPDALLVTDITSGSQDGSGTPFLLAGGAYGGNDNFIENTVVMPTQLVDGDGLGFSVGTTDYDLYDLGGSYFECSSAVTPTCDLGDGVAVTNLVIAPATTSPVPEPSDLVLLSAGLFALGGAALRKRLMQRTRQ